MPITVGYEAAGGAGGPLDAANAYGQAQRNQQHVENAMRWYQLKSQNAQVAAQLNTRIGLAQMQQQFAGQQAEADRDFRVEQADEQRQFAEQQREVEFERQKELQTDRTNDQDLLGHKAHLRRKREMKLQSHLSVEGRKKLAKLDQEMNEIRGHGHLTPQQKQYAANRNRAAARAVVENDPGGNEVSFAENYAANSVIDEKLGLIATPDGRGGVRHDPIPQKEKVTKVMEMAMKAAMVKDELGNQKFDAEAFKTALEIFRSEMSTPEERRAATERAESHADTMRQLYPEQAEALKAGSRMAEAGVQNALEMTGLVPRSQAETVAETAAETTESVPRLTGPVGGKIAQALTEVQEQYPIGHATLPEKGLAPVTADGSIDNTTPEGRANLIGWGSRMMQHVASGEELSKEEFAAQSGLSGRRAEHEYRRYSTVRDRVKKHGQWGLVLPRLVEGYSGMGPDEAEKAWESELDYLKKSYTSIVNDVESAKTEELKIKAAQRLARFHGQHPELLAEMPGAEKPVAENSEPTPAAPARPTTMVERIAVQQMKELKESLIGNTNPDAVEKILAKMRRLEELWPDTQFE